MRAAPAAGARGLVCALVILGLTQTQIARAEGRRLLDRHGGHQHATAGQVTIIDGTPLVDALLPDLVTRTAHREKSASVARGAAEVFYTIDLSSNPPDFLTLSATLRAESPSTRVYVEDAQWGSRVDQAAVDAILAAFDDSTPAASIDPGKGIAEIVGEVYGPPTDVDSDGKVHILVLDIRDGFSGNGSFVAGYYTSHDQTDRFGSNERDLLYIDCDPASPSGPEVLGTVAHEYQHLVHFRADADEALTTPFMNEALSELSQYLCGYGLRSPASYLVETDVSLEQWTNIEPDYARVALWALYLYEQHGATAIGAIFNQPANGIVGIEHGLLARGVVFDEALSDFFVAVAVNAPNSDPRYGFQAFGGKALESAVHSTYPVTATAGVEHRAVDVVRFQGANDLSITATQTGGSGLRARVIGQGPGQVMAVQDLTLGAAASVEMVLGGGFDSYLLLAFTTGVFSASYSYEAGAAPNNVVELGYDDGLAEELGVLAPNPMERGLAVRFTIDDGPVLLDGARFFAADATPFEVHVWEVDPTDGAPGADAITPILVSPAGALGWFDVDLSSAELLIPGGDVFVGLIVPAASADDVSIGLDETEPIAGRSWLFDSGAWLEFADIGLEFADLMIRIEVETIDTNVPELTLGILQDPVLTDAIEVFVTAPTAIAGGNLDGTFEAETQTALTFTPVGGSTSQYVAPLPAPADGAARIIVTQGATFGATPDTLDLSVARTTVSGGTVTQAGAELVVGAGAMPASDVLLTAQAGGGFPGGPTLDGAAPAAAVTFGPLGSELRAPVVVRLAATEGTIGRWENGAWQPLPTQQVGGVLEASTIALGSFTVLSGAAFAAPQPLRLWALSNPVQQAGTLALQLATASDRVTVSLYDVNGRLVQPVHDGPLGAGSHLVSLDLGRRPPGVYFVAANAGEFASRTKIVVVR